MNTTQKSPRTGDARAEELSYVDKSKGNEKNIKGSPEQYARIGTEYYKLCNVPQADGTMERIFRPWSKETILEDHGKAFLADIPRYEGFCTIPSHIDYRDKIDGWLNLYQPLPYTPKEGKTTRIMGFLTHIFGEQLELGLDYLQLLYMNPTQNLPILLLVSKDRCTGKTTFLNFLNLIFGENVAFNTNEEFRDRFNSSWANKLLVCVDEVLLNKEADAQLIKNLSTSKKIKAEYKGKDKFPIKFFGKFVMASNNEENPVYIEPGEVRYWVRKIPKLHIDNIHLLEEMEREVPAFLHFLFHRSMSSRNESRMWFAPHLIITEAFRKIVRCHSDPLPQSMKDILLDIMYYEDIDSVSVSTHSMLQLLENSGYKGRADQSQIGQVFSMKWGQRSSENCFFTAYTYFDATNGCYHSERQKARSYTLTKKFLENT